MANVQGFGETKSYTVTATFDNIGGLKVRAPLKLGGVVIGRVSDITLDEKSYLPKVSIAINEEYKKFRKIVRYRSKHRDYWASNISP